MRSLFTLTSSLASRRQWRAGTLEEGEGRDSRVTDVWGMAWCHEAAGVTQS